MASCSLLLAVLCLLAVLAFLIITTAAMSRGHGEMQQARTSMMRACQLAESGIDVAAIHSSKPEIRCCLTCAERADDLPDADQVVTHVQLNHLSAEEAEIES